MSKFTFFVLILFVIFLCGGFIGASLNPFVWPWYGRLVFVFVCVSVFSSVYDSEIDEWYDNYGN